MDLWKLLLISGILARVSSTIVWETTWINNNKPFRNGSEIEAAPSSAYLNSICPRGTGRLTLRCKTGNETPFTIVMNDTSRYFSVTCVPGQGLSCKPYDGYNTSCPDFQMNYGCDIPTTTSNGTHTATVTSRSHSLTNTIYRSLRGGWPPSPSRTTASSTNKPNTSSMTSSNKPITKSATTTVKIGSSSRPARKHPNTGLTTSVKSIVSTTISSSKRSAARTNRFVTSSVKSGTSFNHTHAQTGNAVSGKQCTCNNGRNGALSVVYNRWMAFAFLISFVWWDRFVI